MLRVFHLPRLPQLQPIASFVIVLCTCLPPARPGRDVLGAAQIPTLTLDARQHLASATDVVCSVIMPGYISVSYTLFNCVLKYSMALEDSDNEAEGLVLDVSVQVPLADVASQISLAVTESLCYNLQECFPTGILENRITELAEAVDSSRHKQELNDIINW